jgi:hypothetical protein
MRVFRALTASFAAVLAACSSSTDPNGQLSPAAMTGFYIVTLSASSDSPALSCPEIPVTIAGKQGGFWQTTSCVARTIQGTIASVTQDSVFLLVATPGAKTFSFGGFRGSTANASSDFVGGFCVITAGSSGPCTYEHGTANWTRR